MSLHYRTLTQLRKSHPAWRLLQADHAPLIASFLYQTFIQPNERVMSQANLLARLEDTLFQLRETEGKEHFPRKAQAYLDDWAQNEKGWLRKFYPHDCDEPHYDLTPATEKALNWLENLTEQSFVGTESRLRTIFELLKQIVTGTETDADIRIAELRQRRAQIDTQIAAIEAGELPLMDNVALRERFLQVNSMARELLSDFRAVEHNFRELDRHVREQIATWEGRKGELLAKIFGERDAIADSDQGRSFRAFWDFLMSPKSQEELTQLLDHVLSMDIVDDLAGDKRLRRIHFDWLEAGEHTQRTIAKLSQQLRRYLDDHAYLENKRIMQLLDTISTGALSIKNERPTGSFMEVNETAPTIQLPLERPLYAPSLKTIIDAVVLEATGDDIDSQPLFAQRVVDKTELAANIEQALHHQSQITLAELIAQHPLEQGLAELIAYLSIAGSRTSAFFDDKHSEKILWQNQQGQPCQATLPRIIFSRDSNTDTDTQKSTTMDK